MPRLRATLSSCESVGRLTGMASSLEHHACTLDACTIADRVYAPLGLGGIRIPSTPPRYGNAQAIVYTLLLFVSGIADNVLKPLMLGRGVEAPMPVILLGALGGRATAGILAMFVGATLLALGYQVFMAWVAADRDAESLRHQSDTPAPN